MSSLSARHNAIHTVAFATTTARSRGALEGVFALEELILDQNCLAHFPLAVSKLVCLRSLRCAENRLHTLITSPPSTPLPFLLSSLTDLDVSKNPLSFADWQYKLSSFSHRHLQRLCMSGCSMTSIPNALCTGLPNLTELHLEESELSSVPADISELLSLKVLNLQRCRKLSRLPIGWVYLPSLTSLCIDGTPITLPPEFLGRTLSEASLGERYPRLPFPHDESQMQPRK